MKNTFKEGRPQQDAKLNKFEKEMREWAAVWQQVYGFSFEDGTVSDKEVISKEDHKAAKFSKGDITFSFGSLGFTISQKLSRKNDSKIVVPGRVSYPLETVNYKEVKENQDKYLILDTNEIKEIRNGKGFKWLIYKDENYGGYYLYCRNDLISFQASEFYFEPEGGQLNLDGKYTSDTFHSLMSKEEGETKRKHLINRTYLKFATLYDCMEWFMDYIVKPALAIHNKQQEELKQPRFQEYKQELKEWVISNKNRFKFTPIINDNSLTVIGKQDVLIHVEDTQKDIYNDQVVSEYNLFSYDLLKERDKFDSTQKFMEWFINTYVMEEMKYEVEQMLKTYHYKGKLQTTAKIVAPSTFKCPGATRKEAITCKIHLEVKEPVFLK